METAFLMAKIADETCGAERRVCHILARDSTLKELDFIISTISSNNEDARITHIDLCMLRGSDDMPVYISFYIVVEQGVNPHLSKGLHQVLKMNVM